MKRSSGNQITNLNPVAFFGLKASVGFMHGDSIPPRMWDFQLGVETTLGRPGPFSLVALSHEVHTVSVPSETLKVAQLSLSQDFP